MTSSIKESVAIKTEGPSRKPRAIKLQTSRGELAVTLLLGGVSIGLYFLLYLFSDLLPQIAAQTREGNKIYALVPLIIALAFSFVHGAFTGRFWDILGLKARK